MKRDKQITIESGDETFTFDYYSYEYRSLMHFIYDKMYTDGFGECKGMGRCGTCAIEVLQAEPAEMDYHRNELQTLARHNLTAEQGVRLACQMMLDDSIDGMNFRLIDNSCDY
jgi:2Fe-2S ferredoxin